MEDRTVYNSGEDSSYFRIEVDFILNYNIARAVIDYARGSFRTVIVVVMNFRPESILWITGNVSIDTRR